MIFNSAGVVGTVERAEADFSFNLALTGQREKSVDFGLPYTGDLASQYRVQLFKTSVTLCFVSPHRWSSHVLHISAIRSSIMGEYLQTIPQYPAVDSRCYYLHLSRWEAGFHIPSRHLTSSTSELPILGFFVGVLYNLENVERNMMFHLKKSYFDIFKINLGYQIAPIRPSVKNCFLVLVSNQHFKKL